MGCVKSKNTCKDRNRTSKKDATLSRLSSLRASTRASSEVLEHYIIDCKKRVKQGLQMKNKGKAMAALRQQKYLERQLKSRRFSEENLEEMIARLRSCDTKDNRV